MAWAQFGVQLWLILEGEGVRTAVCRAAREGAHRAIWGKTMPAAPWDFPSASRSGMLNPFVARLARISSSPATRFTPAVSASSVRARSIKARCSAGDMASNKVRASDSERLFGQMHSGRSAISRSPRERFLAAKAPWPFAPGVSPAARTVQGGDEDRCSSWSSMAAWARTTPKTSGKRSEVTLGTCDAARSAVECAALAAAAAEAAAPAEEEEAEEAPQKKERRPRRAGCVLRTLWASERSILGVESVEKAEERRAGDNRVRRSRTSGRALASGPQGSQRSSSMLGSSDCTLYAAAASCGETRGASRRPSRDSLRTTRRPSLCGSCSAPEGTL